MASKEEVRRVSVYINGSEADLTFKQLTRGAVKLKNELGELVPGTEAFIKKTEELKRVNAILTSINSDIRNVNDSFNSVKDTIDQVKETVMAGLGISAVIGTIKEVVAQNAELSDSLSDIQKTTGLTQASVIHLNDDLKKIDTRTAQENLQGLATTAGKLGISAEKDVLAFVKAADQINVALGEDLGGAEEAINELGKLVDIFKLKDELGLETALIKVGSVINELGAAGTANEGYLVAFAGRLAGIAPAAEISAQNVFGLAAVMDELKQPVEASATAIGQFVVGMGKDIPKFANIAKMSVKDFTTLLKTDGNAALISVLKNVKSTGTGVAGLAESMGMVGEDGARAITALGALSNNLDLLQKRQALANWEFLKGTSLTKEFDVKNNNLAATLEKLGKKINQVWTDSAVLQAITSFIRLIYDNTSAILNMIKVLVIAGVAWGTYSLVVWVANRANMSYLKSLIAVETMTKLSRISTLSLALAQALLTGNITKARQAWALLNVTMGLNPYALVLAGVAALITAFQMYSSRLTEAEQAQKALNELQADAEKSISSEKTKLIALIDIIKNENIAKSARIAKVKELRDLMPEYLKGYTDEEILAGKATNAVGKYVQQLERRAKIESSLKKLTELEDLKTELKQKIADGPKSEGYWERVERGFVTGSNTDEDYIKGIKSRLEKAEKAQDHIRDFMKSNVEEDLKETAPTASVDNSIKARLEYLKNQINILEIAYQNLNRTDKKGMAKNIAERKKLKAELDALSGSVNPKPAPKVDKAKKLFDEAEEERLASMARTAQAIMDNYSQELSETDEHFRKLKEKHSTNAAAVVQIEKERVAKLKQIQEKFRKDDLKTLTDIQNELSQQITASIASDAERELAELNEASRLKIAQLDKEDREIRDRISKQQRRQEQLLWEGKNTEADILTDAISRELQILDASGKLREQFLKSQGKKEADIVKRAAENKKLAELEAAVINADSENPHSESAIAAHIALLDEKHRLEVEAAQKTGADVAVINAKYEADRKLLTEQRGNEAKAFMIQMAQEATSTIFGILANNRQAQLDAELDAIEKNRETELSNKNLTEKQKQAINDKYDDQVREEKIRVWKAEQRAAISQAIINGAIGITAAWKNPLAAPFTIPIIVGTTLAQTALIATQETPKYEHGGYSAVDYTTIDNSKPSGFVRRPTLFSNSSSGRPFVAGEGYKSEYIVSSEQLKDPVIADFVSAIEGIRGVRRFEYGGYSNDQAASGSAGGTTVLQAASPGKIDLSSLEEKMDLFIDAARDAWNYRVFEEKQNKILKDRSRQSG